MSQQSSTQPARLLLSERDVAAQLGVHPKTISRLCESGKMPRPVRLGRAKRYVASQIANWVEAGCQPKK